ncbi:MAG TPA: sigma-70 family RNA polymerase sigma factor [Gemmatimonadales bacterium]|nr:sigma-70 family RNA polymerase sigma factor [Gemmatimonadales bacterium]
MPRAHALEAPALAARRAAPGVAVSDPIGSARAGDPAAFRALYDAHAPRVHALCLRLERDPATAEELTQDVFIRAWRALATFRGEARVSTWLHRIAVNVVLEHRRRTARRLRRVEPVSDLDLLGASAPAHDAGLDMDLRAALETLPPGARAVFVLHEVEGYTHEEIAEMSGVTTGTTKTQLFRARRLLREALAR